MISRSEAVIIYPDHIISYPIVVVKKCQESLGSLPLHKTSISHWGPGIRLAEAVLKRIDPIFDIWNGELLSKSINTNWVNWIQFLDPTGTIFSVTSKKLGMVFE